jgi:hypothetical protein
MDNKDHEMAICCKRFNTSLISKSLFWAKIKRWQFSVKEIEHLNLSNITSVHESGGEVE